MLVTKTFCKAGSLVYIVPTGLLITLHYDVHGGLSSITKGFNGTEELSREFCDSIVRNNIAPYSIQLHGGTTDIWGVLYSDKFTSDYAYLPDGEYDVIVDAITNGDTTYKLYIGNVDSGAASLVNPTAMNTWAKLDGFTPLPTWLVPMDANDTVLQQFMNTNRTFTFKYPLISGFIVYQDGNSPFFHPTYLKEARVARTRTYTDDSGYIMCEVTCCGGEDIPPIIMHYADANRFNINKNSQIVIDGDTVVWCSTQLPVPSNNQIVCKTCGKLLTVPDCGPMTCDDTHCTSVLYPRVVRFCNVLGLDCIAKSTFDRHVHSGDLTMLLDLLLLPSYRKLDIHRNLWEVLFAAISGNVGLDKQWLIKFCNKCNNSYSTVEYYFENPRHAHTELDIQMPKRLVQWLSDPANLLELSTIVNSEQIDVSVPNKVMKFDGPKLLRDKTIYITGKFFHGDSTDIVAILSSYGAIVTTDFDEYVQCVVVGDIKDGIDGGALQSARAFKIPTFTETEFFAKYDIDSDLEKYLS